MSARLQLEQNDPGLLQLMAPAVAMPAGTELRLSRGLDALLPEDVPALLEAHRGDVVEKLRQRHLAQVEAQYEAGAEARAAAAAEQEALWAQAQREGEERFNASQRAAYVQRLHQGWS